MTGGDLPGTGSRGKGVLTNRTAPLKGKKLRKFKELGEGSASHLTGGEKSRWFTEPYGGHQITRQTICAHRVGPDLRGKPSRKVTQRKEIVPYVNGRNSKIIETKGRGLSDRARWEKKSRADRIAYLKPNKSPPFLDDEMRKKQLGEPPEKTANGRVCADSCGHLASKEDTIWLVKWNRTPGN